MEKLLVTLIAPKIYHENAIVKSDVTVYGTTTDRRSFITQTSGTLNTFEDFTGESRR